MPKTKKNIISNKLNKLSLKIEAIHKELDGPNQSIKKLKQDLASATQSFAALYDHAKSRKEAILAQWRIQDEEQQKILKEEGFGGLKLDRMDDNNSKEEDELEKLEDAIKQLEVLQGKLYMAQYKMELIKLEKGEITQEAFDNYLQGQKEQIRKTITERDKMIGSDEIVKSFNAEFLKHAKKIILSDSSCKDLSKNARNRIEGAKDMGQIQKIMDSRIEQDNPLTDKNQQALLLCTLINDPVAQLSHLKNVMKGKGYVFDKLDRDMWYERARIDMILEERGEEVKLGLDDSIWYIVDLKQSTSVNQSKVVEMNPGQFRNNFGG